VEHVAGRYKRQSAGFTTRPLMSKQTNIHYTSLGAVSGIGASCQYLQLDGYGLILDAGMDPNAEGAEAIPDYDFLKKKPVHAIIITHAHFDHIGSLPIAIQHFPHARIHMTPPTAELTEQMLYHYLNVQRKKGLEKGEKFSALYTEEFVGKIRYIFQSFGYEWGFPLHGFEESGIQFSFYDAGHILGSAGVLIEWKGKRIFYVGNTRKSAQFILKGAKYPPKVDLLITESTYGANAEAERIVASKEIKRFAKLLTDRIKLGGVVLIPVFALGRTQEILTLLNRLRQKNQIPAVPIYITGFGIQVNKTYDRLLHKTYPEFTRGTLQRISFGRWSRGRKLRGPAILLFTSGMMLRGTASFDYAKQLAESPLNGIFFVGYGDPETPAGLFRQKKYESLKTIFDVDQISCEVEIFHFSAHSNRRELMEMIKQMEPKSVILTHGDRQAIEWMRNRISRAVPGVKVFIPAQSKQIEITL
jgi:cleavage and polyadenylation specificity factor subunit 3